MDIVYLSVVVVFFLMSGWLIRFVKTL